MLIAIGHPVQAAIQAAGNLEKKGISVAVTNARFVKPLDQDLILDWVKRVDRVITIEENALQGGFGSAVLEALQESRIYLRLGIPDTFVPQGSQEILRRNCNIDAQGIEDAGLFLLETSESIKLPSAEDYGKFKVVNL